MAARPVALLGWLAWLAALATACAGGSPSCAAAETSTEAQPAATEVTDWTLVINQLRQRVDEMPGQTSVRKQLAVAYNNYGVQLSREGRLDAGKRQIEEALRLDATNQQFRFNLAGILVRTAQMAAEQHHSDDARLAIDRALSVMPDSAQAYALLGEVEYDAQRFKEAKAAWQRALTLDPSLAEVRTRLDQVSKELPVESQFERVSQFNFDIRYTDEIDRLAGSDIRDMLLQARRDVGTDFAHWPRHKIVVLMYKAEQFRQLRAETPDWVGGQFDGKIRVPLPSQTMDPDTVKRVLVHEYTHAVVHDLTDDRCPTWFNEGLAEYEAWKSSSPPWPLLRKAWSSGGPVAWADLSARFSTSSSAEQVGLAYEQSHSIVRYLAQRYGMWRIRQVLAALKDGAELNATLASEFHTKLPRLEAEWKTWLAGELGRPAGS